MPLNTNYNLFTAYAPSPICKREETAKPPFTPCQSFSCFEQTKNHKYASLLSLRIRVLRPHRSTFRGPLRMQYCTFLIPSKYLERMSLLPFLSPPFYPKTNLQQTQTNSSSRISYPQTRTPPINCLQALKQLDIEDMSQRGLSLGIHINTSPVLRNRTTALL